VVNSLCVCDAYGMCPQGCPHCEVCSGVPEDPRPASMLQPFTFSGDENDPARRVRMIPVDEAEDER
jgi:hypothetical protein